MSREDTRATDAAGHAQGGRRRHVRRLRGGRGEGAGAGDQDRHDRHRGRRLRGQDRRLQHAGLRGAARLRRPRSHRRVHLGDLGRPRVGAGRAPAASPRRATTPSRPSSSSAKAAWARSPTSRTSSRSSSPCRASRCWATSRPPSTGPRSARARAPTASASPAGAGAARRCTRSRRPTRTSRRPWRGTARPRAPFPITPNPVDGFDVAKDIKMPVARPLRRDGHRAPRRRGREEVRRAGQAGQPERRDRGLSGRGARLLRRLPALVQRRRGRGRVEALHGLVRQVRSRPERRRSEEGRMPFVNIRIYEG